MRILFVQKMAGVAGAERYYQSFLPALVRKGHSVDFFCAEHESSTHLNDPFCEQLEQAGVCVHRHRFKSAYSPRIAWAIRKVLKRRQIQILQTNLAHADMWGLMASGFLPRGVRWLSVKHSYDPRFQATHGMDVSKANRLAPSHLIVQATATFSDGAVAISESLASFLIESKALRASDIQAIPYGFDLSDKSVGDEGAESDIVIVGRLVPVKQHELLLESLALVVQKRPSVSLAIVGDGELRSELEARVKALGLEENVTFYGFQSNVFAYLKKSKISVFPSRAEGFGLVLLESWFCEKAVVAFDVPALNEIIEDGIDGVLVPGFDVEQFAVSLIELLEDESLRAELGRRGFEKYRAKYSLDVMLNKYEEVYRRLLESS